MPVQFCRVYRVLWFCVLWISGSATVASAQLALTPLQPFADGEQTLGAAGDGRQSHTLIPINVTAFQNGKLVISVITPGSQGNASIALFPQGVAVSTEGAARGSVASNQGGNMELSYRFDKGQVFQFTITNRGPANRFWYSAQVVDDSPRQQAGIFVEQFNTGSSGWTVVGDAQGDSAQPTYRAVGGNSGGYIEARDDAAGGVWYWSTPESFRNALQQTWRAREHRRLMLVFDLRQSDISSPFDDSDVLLKGAGHTLAFDTAQAPGTTWTSYSVPLIAAQWRNKDTKQAATEAEMSAALLAIELLWIRGEYRTGPDTGGLDNVGWHWADAQAHAISVRFVHQNGEEYTRMNELAFDQPFQIEVHYSEEPAHAQHIVRLQWAGAEREIAVIKVAGAPTILRSKQIRLAR